MFLMVVSVPLNQVRESCTMYIYKGITVSSTYRCSLPVDSVMHASTQTGWLSHCLQNNVREICLSFWACAVTLHRTQRILEVLCNCEQSTNTWTFFGRRVREYAEDTCLPHSRKTTVVHKLCDASSMTTEVCELVLSWSEWWKSRTYTISPQRWNVVSARCNIGRSCFSYWTTKWHFWDHEFYTDLWQTFWYRSMNTRSITREPVPAARQFFISSHRTSRLIKLSEVILSQGEPETWNIF